MPDEMPGATPDAGSPETPATPIQDRKPEGGRRPSTREEFRQATVAALRAQTQPAAAAPAEPQADPKGSSGPEGGEDAEPDLSQVPDAAAQAAAEAGEESQDGGDPDGDESQPRQQWPKSAVDRIQRHKRQRDEARDRVKALEAELAAAKAQGAQAGQQPAPEDDAKAAAHPEVAGEDPARITERLEQARHTVNAVEDLLDQLHDDPEAVEQQLRQHKVELSEYTPAEMRKFLRRVRASEREVMEAAPRRIQFLRDEHSALQRAVEVIPELKDPESPRFKRVQEVVRQYPALKQRPDWAYHAAVYALGFEALEAQQAKASAPAPKPGPKPLPAPPKVPGAGTAKPTTSTSQEARLEALRQKAYGPDGTRADRDAYAAALLRG